MTQITEIVEGSNIILPDYTNTKFNEKQIEAGKHRTFVAGAGGSWDDEFQINFLKKMGLKPSDRLIDIGCGALRAGRFFIDYLDAGNYFGVDANLDLLTIGYDRELTDEQRAKLPSANLRANDRFNVNFGVPFTMGIAQSVFTHVSLNHMRLCLARLAPVMAPGGVFYASYCEQPEGTPVDHIYKVHPKGRTYFYEKNVYWYHRSDLEYVAHDGPWKCEYVGEYDSPQNQVMFAYTRISDDEYRRASTKSTTGAGSKSDAASAGSPKAAGSARRIVRGARNRVAKAINPK